MAAKEFSVEEIELAKRISVETPAEAIFLNAPVHNHLVFLSGRKTLMGFPGHIWSHGYQGSYQREKDVKIMLKGEPNAKSLIDKYKPSYATLGPHEKRIGAISKFFDANFTRVITTKSYKVYDLTQKKDSLALSNGYAPVTNRQDLTDQTHGLCVWYYDNAHWQDEPVFQDVNEHIGFNWSDEDEKPVSSPFSALWKGFININAPGGKYTFKLTSDDGSWLYIDDILVIDNGGNHATKSVTGTVNLEPGKHKIMIKYFDAGGGAVLSLLWTPPNGKESKIPVDRLKVKD